MNIDRHFNEIKHQLENRITFLIDKPEETLESTLKALWFSAYGIPKSAEAAIELELPHLNDLQFEKLQELIEIRLNNTPLSYITGRQRFMGIDFLCDSRALIPRKETEILGRKALAISEELSLGKEKINVFDICCGAGNLALSIASLNKNAFVYATDLSSDAVELTRDNIKHLNQIDRVVAIQGDLFEALDKPEFHEYVDLIVCNPPYISVAKVKNMNPEISENEPSLAFDGGFLGTKIIQRLIIEAPKFLIKYGWLAFEVGVGQGEFIMQLCIRSKRYEKVECLKDDHGNIRVLMAQK